MEEKIIELESNWIMNDLEPWLWHNSKRYKNYMAITTRDENGDFNYDWLKMSSESDEFFNVSKVNVGDVLLAGCKDRYNSFSFKRFYKVTEKADDSMKLIMCKNYKDAVRA